MSMHVINSKWIKGLYSLFALLFFISAVVQYNDPDPLHWIFLYGLGSMISLFTVLGKIKVSWIYLCIGAALLQILIVMDGAIQWYLRGVENILDTPMSKEKPYIEEVREFFGSLIVLTSNLFLLYFQNKSRKTDVN
jgi:hypothetical protein